MFFGTVPNQCIEQILRVIPFDRWSDAYVCCSGTFKIEQALHGRFQNLRIHGNDVSLWSCAIGQYLIDQPVELTFHDRLQFIEDRFTPETPFVERVGAVLVAQEMSRYARNNSYCLKHWHFYVESFDQHLQKACEKLQNLHSKAGLHDYFPGDWRDHIRHAAENGGGVAAFPPFFRGDYESQYKFIEANIKWKPAPYDLYNPKDLGGILDWVDELGIQYCILSDQVFENRKPMLEFVAGRKVPHYCYSSTSRSSVRHIFSKPEPFLYKPIVPAKLTRDSKVTVVPAEAKHLNFIKDIYLAKGIIHSSGLVNYFVFVDDMLAGGVIYALSKYGATDPETGKVYHASESVYLLSDVSLTTENKLSKLIAMLATSATLTTPVSTRLLSRIQYIVTTARSKNPVSMKYRGIYTLLSRRESDDPIDNGKLILQYGAAIRPEDPNAIYREWFDRHSGLAAKAGDGGRKGRRR